MASETPIRCLLINLRQSTVRLEHMRRVLGRAGIAFERCEAVDASEVEAHPAYSRVPPLRGRQWSPGEIACLLSHREAWLRIAEGTEAFGAVFEDDLHIDLRLREILMIENIPLDADIVKLETVRKFAAVSRRTRPGPAGVRFARLGSLHDGAGAYVISRTAARRAADAVELFDLPVDDVLFEPKHTLGRVFRRYQVVPALAIQDVVLPKAQRQKGLESIVDPNRRTRVIAPQTNVPRNRLLPLHNLPLRLIQAAWRRTWWRFAMIPFGGETTSPGATR